MTEASIYHIWLFSDGDAYPNAYWYICAAEWSQAFKSHDLSYDPCSVWFADELVAMEDATHAVTWPSMSLPVACWSMGAQDDSAELGAFSIKGIVAVPHNRAI